MKSKFYAQFPAALLRGAACGLMTVALTGCGRDEIKVYKIAKADAAAAATEAPAANPAAPLTWTTPAGWEQKSPGEMRVASFGIVGANGKLADVSVIPLPGGAGGDLPNVNRWRGQVGLAPVAEAELPALAQAVEIAGQPAKLYQFDGQNPGSGEPMSVLSAVALHNGTTWFFKMTGDVGVVTKQRTAFIEFLKSVKFAQPSTMSELTGAASLPPSHPPIGGSAMPETPTGTAISSEGKPDWQVPAGWREVGGGQFLIAKFLLAGDGGAQAAVNVSRSAGDGGGLAANVNRWRGQLGLPAISEILTTPLEVAGGKADLVDFAGTDARSGQPARLVGALVPQGDQTWFYKLMGDEKIVEAQKSAFVKFVQSVKY